MNDGGIIIEEKKQEANFENEQLLVNPREPQNIAEPDKESLKDDFVEDGGGGAIGQPLKVKSKSSK